MPTQHEQREWILIRIRALAERLGCDQTGVDIADICTAELNAAAETVVCNCCGADLSRHNHIKECENYTEQ